MHKNTGENATEENLFTDGDPANSVPRSILNSDVMNTLMLELVNVVEGSGQVLDPDNDAQVLQAIRQISGVAGLNPSAVINGGAIIAQRDEAVIDDTGPKFGAVDRLMAQISDSAAGGSPTFGQAIAPWSASGQCAQVTGLDTSVATNTLEFVYRIESRDALRFANRDAVYACKLHQTTGVIVPATITIESAAATEPDDWSGATTTVLTGSAQNIPSNVPTEIFLPVPDMGDCVKGIQITISLAIPAGPGTGSDYEISELRCNAGQIAVPYSPGAYHDELAACRRYYERYRLATLDVLAHMTATSTTLLRGYLRYDVPKRTQDVTVRVTDPAELEAMPGAAAITAINEAGGNISLDGAHIEAVSSGLTAGDTYLLRAKDGTVVDIEIDAELHPISVTPASGAPAAPATITVPGSTDADGNYNVSWDSSATATAYQLIEKRDSGAWSLVYDGANLSRGFSNKQNGTYQYAVRAYNAYGYSAYTYSSTFDVNRAPAAPATITVPASDNDGNYGVSWDTAANADTYTLQRRKNGGTWQTIQDGVGTSYGESGLDDGDYEYRVRACNVTGCSAWTTSSVVTVDTPPAAPVLDADSAYKSVTFSWTTVPGAVRYEFQIREEGGNWYTVFNGDGTGYAVARAEPTVFSGRVRACDNSSCGSWSNIATGSTL